MKIQVLGPGCTKCCELVTRTEAAVRQLSLDVPVEKVADIREIMAFGVMTTPALVIDGKVRFSGRVPNVDELAKIITSPA